MNINQSLRTALEAASLALSASHNLTVTDRSDLPRAEWPVYVTDHSAELALINGALQDSGVRDRVSTIIPMVLLDALAEFHR